MSSDLMKCPNCGSPVKPEDEKCGNCGHDLKGSSGPDSREIIVEALDAKYEIQEKIGSGGMAVVYKAVQRTLSRPVAIKIVHQNLVHDTEFINRFIKEARVAASLNHPNIITIHDVDSIGQVNYMTMEYLDGEPLSSIIRRKGQLGIAETLKIAIPIAQALDYLHKAGYVHRDVKSSNIFLSKDGRPVLTDFGIVYTNESLLSQPGTVLGTPEFMSPEQANGQEIDGRSDLYSLGVIMYECLTGRMPFRTDNPLTTVFKVINEPPPEPVSKNPKVPDWLNAQILNLLSKNPNNRVQSGKKLASNLFNKKMISHEFQEGFEEPRTQRIPAAGGPAKAAPSKASSTAQKKTETRKGEAKTGKSRKPVLVAISLILAILIAAILYLGFSEGEKPIEVSEIDENQPNVVNTSELSAPPADDNTIYMKVDVHPEFPGGISAYYDYAQGNVNYPDKARNEGVEGKVLVEFVVEMDGSVSNVNVIRGLSIECDAEATRLINGLPKFTPGVLKGKAVRVKVILPVSFG